MSKGKLPYFCWYPADFEVDENVKLMNIEEIGLYAICLNHCWLNGSLPSDPLEIARAMKVSKGQFLRAWPRVAPCFTAREDGRWTNPRQERERVEANARTDHGRKGAAARWKNGAHVMPEHSSGMGRVMPRAYGSDSVSDFEFGSEGSAEGGGMRAEWDDQWQDFRSKYIAARPDLIDEDFLKAHHVWRVLDFSQREDSILGIAARIDAGQWDDPQFIPKPEKYLREDRKRKVLPRGSKLSRGEATSLKALEIFRRSQ